jgi:hypothetical protein
MATYIFLMVLWVASGPLAGDVIYSQPHSYQAVTEAAALEECQDQGQQLFEELRRGDLLGPAESFNLACIPPLGGNGEPS